MDFNQIKDIADDNQRRVTTALSASRIGVFEYEPQKRQGLRGCLHAGVLGGGAGMKR
jgi:hypothetical protein